MNVSLVWIDHPVYTSIFYSSVIADSVNFVPRFNKKNKFLEIAYGSSLTLSLNENLHPTKNRVPNTVVQKKFTFADREQRENVVLNVSIDLQSSSQCY